MEFYQKLDPSQVPDFGQSRGRGRRIGPLRTALLTMEIGDVIAVPPDKGRGLHWTAKSIAIKVTRYTHTDGVTYVRRIG